MKREYYRTANFYLSAFLCCKGLDLINIDKANPHRATFVFEDGPEREEWVSLFNFGKEALVDARQYALTLKELKNKLYSI